MYVLNKFGRSSLFGEFVRFVIHEVEEGGSLDESLLDDSTYQYHHPKYFVLILSVIPVNDFGLFDQILIV